MDLRYWKYDLKRIFKSLLLISPLLILNPYPLKAGTYTNDLAKCMIEESTSKEKLNLVRWAVRLYSAHPEIKIVNLNEFSKNKLDKQIGILVNDLLLNRCKVVAKKAIEYDGEASLVSAFGTVARVSANKVMSHPDVQKASGEWGKYLDYKNITK